ncbi:MAG: DUF2634 domain-containing protein [Bacillota bacterium]|jgi:phage baseplate assembly protein W
MTRMLPGDYENDLITADNAQKIEAASKTWNLSAKSESERYLDGIDALRQSVSLALETPRYAHLIYSFDYGSELISLFGHSNELVQTEGIRLIREALLVDDRIQSVDNFQFDFTGDSVEISFVVKSRFGNFSGSVSL